MKDIMGLIYTGDNDSQLRELTLSRAIAALPVIGRYRVIDFQVSSLVNSGARNIGVITQRNYHSLMDHLGTGKEWNLNRKKDGLFILPPFLTKDNVGVYKGILDAMYSNLGYLRRSTQEYVVMVHGNTLFSIDFSQMLEQHIKTAADITVLCTKAEKTGGESSSRTYFNMGEDHFVTQMEVDPAVPKLPYCSLACAVVRRKLLIELIESRVNKDLYSFDTDILLYGVRERKLRIAGYVTPVCAWYINSVQTYYELNMQALEENVRRELFNKERPVYTKVRDDMPTRYGEQAKASKSLIANGGKIEGTVENSIIFRGVRIQKGAVVRNCIVMQDSVIGENAEIEHCILDKQVHISSGGRLVGHITFPIVINKNMTI